MPLPETYRARKGDTLIQTRTVLRDQITATTIVVSDQYGADAYLSPDSFDAVASHVLKPGDAVERGLGDDVLRGTILGVSETHLWVETNAVQPETWPRCGVRRVDAAWPVPDEAAGVTAALTAAADAIPPEPPPSPGEIAAVAVAASDLEG